MKNIKIVLALLISLVVTACGGGGGGVGSIRTPLYIDSTNSRVIAATAIKVASGATFELFNPENFATDLYDALFSGNNYKLIPCVNVNGNVTVDLTTPTGTMTYSNCENFGKIFDGKIYVHNASLDPATDRVFASLNFNSLTVTAGAITFALAGNYELTANGLTPNIAPVFKANGVGMELSITSNTGQTEIISDFDFTYKFLTPTTTTYASDFTLASSKLGGSFHHLYSVAIPYEKNSGTTSPYPYSGDAVISGLSPTKLKISVVGNGNIRQDLIQVDRSSDGSNYPYLADYTWTQLNAP